MRATSTLRAAGRHGGHLWAMFAVEECCTSIAVATMEDGKKADTAQPHTTHASRPITATRQWRSGPSTMYDGKTQLLDRQPDQPVTDQLARLLAQALKKEQSTLTSPSTFQKDSGQGQGKQLAASPQWPDLFVMRLYWPKRIGPEGDPGNRPALQSEDRVNPVQAMAVGCGVSASLENIQWSRSFL